MIRKSQCLFQFDSCLISHGCKLLLRFEDSHGDGPDPLTEIALADIRTDGMRKFVQNFMREENSASGHSDSETDGLSLQLNLWLRDRSTDLKSGSTTFRQSKIRKFKMVTVCRSRWPDLSHHKSHQDAIDRISETMESFKRGIRYLGTRDLGLERFAIIHHIRLDDCRARTGWLRLLQSMLKAYESRKSLIVWLPATDNHLSEHIQRVEEMGDQFRRSALSTRCLIWICWNVMRVQGELLLGCSDLLDKFSWKEENERQKIDLILQVIFHISWDVAELFAEQNPLHFVSAIEQFLKRSDAIALDFYLDENLAAYELREDRIGGNITPACRSWMESVMGSEAQLLSSTEVFRHLWKIMSQELA